MITELTFLSLKVERSYLYLNIYIFIAFALDESVIFDVLQFQMKNIYKSCDLGCPTEWSNVNASQ